MGRVAELLSLGHIMRPVPPEPKERPKIKRAMRAARIMKGITGLLSAILLMATIIVGRTTEWYFGAAVLVVSLLFFLLGYLAARCPRCGQVWWGEGTVSVTSWWDRSYAEPGVFTEDETQTMVCRRCRLDIGLGLRDP